MSIGFGITKRYSVIAQYLSTPTCDYFMWEENKRRLEPISDRPPKNVFRYYT